MRTRRGALQTLEMLIVLPVMLAVIGTSVQTALLLLAQQRLHNAVENAAKTIATEAWYARSVERLAHETVSASLRDLSWGEECIVTVKVDDEVANLVRVTARVPAKAVAPDVFGAFGLGLKDRTMTASMAAVVQ